MTLWREGRPERLVGSRLASLNIRSPFTMPSGTVTTMPSVIARMARDVPEIGFLTTKTLSVEPRPGYREPIIHEYYPGCFVNAVGLANPGAENFREAMRPHLPLHDGKPLIVSIMGQDPEEFLDAARILDPVADAFELNLSCPHVKGAGQSVGSDTQMMRTVIELLKAHLGKPIIPKLSPNVPDVVGIARLCEAAGADALSLINTVGPGSASDADGNPVLSNVVGGLSGAGILPVGLKVVREVASAVRLPIIASGGIGSVDDVRAYCAAGATLFAVGSALVGMTTPEIAEFFARLATDLEAPGLSGPVPAAMFTRTAYTKTRVAENADLGADIFALRLEAGGQCDPGRFFFLRLPGIGEKPFSPARSPELLFLVRQVGPFTSALRDLKPGDPIYVRGPYGRGFPEPGPGTRIVLVGGGTGVAPLVMVGERRPDCIARAFFGFSGKPTLGTLLDQVPELRVVIDPPGSVGEVVRRLVEDVAENPDLYEECQAFLCGPSKMLEFAAHVLETTVPRHRISIGREDVMRCGIGICGSCGTETGLRSCVDGPVIPRAEPGKTCAHR